MFEEYSQHDKAVYGGYLSDTSKLLESSSGGIATALAEHIIKSGGYVAGAVYSKDYYKSEYLITNKLEDIKRLKGSKYTETEKGSVYSDVKKLLDAGKTVLFFGLPCHTAAMKMFCAENLQNLILCELICYGPTSAKVHREYLDFLEQKYADKITDFSVRFKKGKWKPRFLRTQFSNGRVFEKPFSATEYGKAFGILGRESCYDCKFKGNNRTGDIMIGDFWSAHEGDEFWNEKGVSVIFAETEKGDGLINSLTEIKIFKTSFERAVQQNPMVIYSKTKSPLRDKFAEIFAKEGLFAASKKCMRKKERTKNFLISALPSDFKDIIKNLLKK